MTPAQRDRATGALTRQIHEVTTLVNDLIELARDEEPVPLVESVRLAPLVEHAVAAARGHWPGLAFTVETAADPVLNGVPARLSRLLANLLSNAAKFSGDVGEVEITLTTTELTVRDHGPGIAPDDLPYVFDRFYRARAARSLVEAPVWVSRWPARSPARTARNSPRNRHRAAAHSSGCASREAGRPCHDMTRPGQKPGGSV